jgi:aldehyde dehydrogenase (NAD+)
VLVAQELHDELVARLVARANALRLGDPMDRATQMGPLAFQQQQDRVLGMLEAAYADGVEAAAGGGRPESAALRDGLFVAPTVLTGVQNTMAIAQDEIFGPVCSVIPFRSEADAVRMANATRFGLAAGIWTKDVQRAHRVAHAVQAGTIWINAYRTMSPSVPFGGFKSSGYGRENGYEALLEYTRTKAVWVELEGAPRDPFKMG